MIVERVTVERVVENPTFPELEIVYALPEKTYGTPELIPMPPDFTVPPPETGAARSEVIETTATVFPLEPEPTTPMTPPTAVPVPDGTAERPSPKAPPREADAAPPPKSQGGDTPSRPGSPTTSGKSTPGTQNTNPERVGGLISSRRKSQREERRKKSNRKARRTPSKEKDAPQTSNSLLRARKFRKRKHLYADSAGLRIFAASRNFIEMLR